MEMDLGNMRRAIKARQGETAREARIARTQLSKIENGRIRPTAAEERRILDALARLAARGDE